MLTETEAQRFAQQLAESALEQVELMAVFEFCEDLSDEEGEQILRLVKDATVVIGS